MRWQSPAVMAFVSCRMSRAIGRRSSRWLSFRLAKVWTWAHLWTRTTIISARLLLLLLLLLRGADNSSVMMLYGQLTARAASRTSTTSTPSAATPATYSPDTTPVLTCYCVDLFVLCKLFYCHTRLHVTPVPKVNFFRVGWAKKFCTLDVALVPWPIVSKRWRDSNTTDSSRNK